MTRGPRVGDPAPRPDGPDKVTGRFAYSSDLTAPGMLWGAVVRSPHPSARILGIDPAPALALPGVAAVLTADDVPGRAVYGLAVADQPVLARDVVRHHGEAVAAVAAATPDLARRAARAVAVAYAPLDPLIDPAAAAAAAPVHPAGNVYRHLVVRRGDVAAAAAGPDLVTVEDTYEVGRQDPAFLGLESGLAVPAADGGVDLSVSTQFLHADRDQIAASLGLPEDRVRLTLAGVGGAFGGREDLTLHLHLCLLALRTGRPVGMAYDRSESFVGHVHRHPARLWYRHRATRGGTLVSVEARVLLDGGAYQSTSAAVLANACCFAAGPYRVPHAHVEGWAVRTNHPPAGALRGFGIPQVCFAHESQMDALAAALGMDPVDLRRRNALTTGDTLLTGQRITGTAPAVACLDAAVAHALPDPPGDDPLRLPGGTGLATGPGDVRRGVGVALGFKNLMYSEGFQDLSTASVRLERVGAEAVATVHCAAAEVGQGFVTLAQQIVRTELGVDRVVLRAADTTIGDAGSSSASRQSWMSGGAVAAACAAVRDEVLARVAAGRDGGPDAFALRDGEVVSRDGGLRLPVAEVVGADPVEAVRVFTHAPTAPLDADGQGDAHVAFVFTAHRAVVDVDPGLGSVQVVQVATGQDIGRALNPLAVTGQLEGGIAQGLGLALLEDVATRGGRVATRTFQDYLVPTALDVGDVVATLIEEPEPGAPYGAKGVGEAPTLSSIPAIIAAVRAATGRPLRRIPVRPEHVALGDDGVAPFLPPAAPAPPGVVDEPAGPVGKPWLTDPPGVVDLPGPQVGP